jgi:hypothetical protein
MSTINFLAKLLFVPFGESFINANIGRDFGSGRVCKGIMCITAVESIVQCSGEGNKESKIGLFDTGGIGFRKRMKLGSRARRAIAAVTRPAFTTEFDTVLPMGIEEDCNRGKRAGSTKHAKIVELVKLFMLASFPLWPGVQGLEFPLSEMSKGPLGGSLAGVMASD